VRVGRGADPAPQALRALLLADQPPPGLAGGLRQGGTLLLWDKVTLLLLLAPTNLP